MTRVRVIMLEGGAVEQLSPAEEEAVQTVEERLDELPAHDRCLVMRRRCGRLQREVAADLGRSLQHIRDMEAGRTPADELVGYWEC